MNEDQEKMKRLLDEIVQDEDYRTWRDKLRRRLYGRMVKREEAERRLLGETLHDEDYIDFREALRRRCLDELPAPRWSSRLLRAGLLAAGAAAVLLLILLHPPVPEGVPVPETEPAYVLHSRRLSARQMAASETIRTVRSRDHGFNHTGAMNHPSGILADAAYLKRTDRRIETIRTHAQESRLERLSDVELLALFEPRPCAIVQMGTEKPILYFFD